MLFINRGIYLRGVTLTTSNLSVQIEKFPVPLQIPADCAIIAGREGVRDMKKWLIWILTAAVALSLAAALAEDYHVNEKNGDNFAALLVYLARAYEQPSLETAQAVESWLTTIRETDARDGEVADAIVEHWQAVYIDPDYPLYMHDGGERAEALEALGLPDESAHALVVLGYELKNGEMTAELKGRCDAAAAAARSLPNAILVCSGGATGDNNPKGHTEAGMMRDYLVNRCGIDASRIFIDERAMTTTQNAINTFAMLMDRGIRTYTIVTSSYHQRWGQAVYNAMAAVCRQRYGYEAQIVGNYCYDTAPSSEHYRQDDRIAATQIAAVLELPRDSIDKMRSVFDRNKG